jgi:UDP-N-acetylmuramate dehydrogenase
VPRPLSELTTLRLGGPPRALIEAATEEELVAAVRTCDGQDEPLLLLAGGSNVVVADAGFAGTVVRILTLGVAEQEVSGGAVRLDVQAGEPWDPLVATCVEQGLAGIECLAGIPGSVGATPIQNVGAYGQEVADTLVAVRVLDRSRDAIDELGPEDCGFTYRSSAFKREPGRWVVLSVSYALERSAESRPVRYAELARTLDVEPGGPAPLPAVREAVLALRRSKGMVLDPADPDSISAGSFFTNPILTAGQFDDLAGRAGDSPPPAWPEEDGHVKTSAAWLIERAGFSRGQGDPGGIAISAKHTLALTNRGAGTTSELLALAREIAAGVRDRFGVDLVPEPVLVGEDWP